MKSRIVLLALAVLPLTIAACDGDGVAGLGDEAEFAVVFAPESGTSAALSSDVSLSVMGPAGPADGRVSLSSVESIVLPIGVVEARTADSASAEWIEAGAINGDVDLLNLPDDGIELVNGSLPEGQYDALRFWLTADASITLAEAITVGRTTFEPGTYTLEIPSADQAGVRLRTDFEVTADGQVLTVLVDGDASVNRVMATGSGALKIAPVLNVRNQDGQHVGEVDEGEHHGGNHGDDDPGGAEVEGFVESVDGDTFTLDDGTVVQVTDSTDLAGDFLALSDVADALAAGDSVEAEAHGQFDADSTLIAHYVEFETDDDDGDGEVDDADDGEVEVRGRIVSLDREGRTFDVVSHMDTITVTMDDQTLLDFEDGYESWDDVADAYDAGTDLRAEAEGEWTDETTLLAWEVEFAERHHGGGGGGGGGGMGGL